MINNLRYPLYFHLFGKEMRPDRIKQERWHRHKTKVLELLSILHDVEKQIHAPAEPGAWFGSWYQEHIIESIFVCGRKCMVFYLALYNIRKGIYQLQEPVELEFFATRLKDVLIEFLFS